MAKAGSGKAESLKPRLPRGLFDRREGDLLAQARMLEVIRATFGLYGFEALETPFIEYTEALGKFLPDLDRPNEGVFSFQDDDESWLSLRYDLTAPLARFVAENFDGLPKPYRSMRAGYVFRNEKPGPGRFRQFMQCDADIVGAASVAADAEICMMAADTLDRLGLAGQYAVKVNNRKVLDGLLEASGLSGDGMAGQRLAALRAIDKLDRLGFEGVRLLLGPGRRDESGDFTKGAGLAEAAIERILAYVSEDASLTGGDAPSGDVFASWEEAVGGSEIGREGVAELRTIMSLCAAAGYGHDRIRPDPSIVRGLEYYTGPVFEADLTFAIASEDGQPIRVGAVASGGRYDGLVGRFRPEPVPATGFSIGVSRLFAALQLAKSPLVDAAEEPGPVVVLVLDRENIADYQRLVARLRGAGIRAEAYLGGAGMKAQMKYADRRKAPLAIIQGSNEREAGEVQIKDLIEGARAAQSIASNAEWKAARPAQISVPEAEMVDQVRAMLERHFEDGAA
ncbi:MULTISPECIES: histidine--tRNA ligase [Methylobacterium]|uniref:Histidine--tRNA ligase n=1 Tax=Methylobacterium jeotgali TaxID=381630 RepID=A0ABQ4T2Y1_9HYPH|nr:MULTISPECIES: histidine--tRNA ligase [Methylobacterium]PIU06324.1 MAG: histidine--tRNA ligase [Methylobacterium sp. CG09_land_8_20_14_0_10_71_15]PIU13647.1 MAG: histidine--tRNA ligase [Methylobacterium sp. CG08_land_8_20_14_0_20_71_15]GBU17455.1 histidyl tRNA synthetase [Methylobacterium sp.]GJE08241.1 Histidine--tRNA ligase [Methylobacterium jeotgali]